MLMGCIVRELMIPDIATQCAALFPTSMGDLLILFVSFVYIFECSMEHHVHFLSCDWGYIPSLLSFLGFYFVVLPRSSV